MKITANVDATPKRNGVELEVRCRGVVYIPMYSRDCDDAPEVLRMSAVACGAAVDLTEEEAEGLAIQLIEAAYETAEQRKEQYQENQTEY